MQLCKGGHHKYVLRLRHMCLLFTLPPTAAQETRPFSCGQNEAYRSDRRRWHERHCSTCSPTQTLRQIHHAANAKVTILVYFYTLYY